MVLGKLDRYIEKNKTGSLFTSYIRINTKQLKHLNVRPQTTKLPERNIGSTLFDVVFSHLFLDMSPQARGKNKQMGLHQTKSFCTAKKIINKTKRQPH